MRSIRLSLVVYFLVLLAVALFVVFLMVLFIYPRNSNIIVGIHYSKVLV